MDKLSTIVDVLSLGYLTEVLDIVSLMALFTGIAILVIKNPIVALISLIGLFASISIYLIYIGLTFIGFSYLIVYIGAVSILFLFILMLINIRNSELQSNNWDSISLGLFVAILFHYCLSGLMITKSNVMINNNYFSKLKSLFLNTSSASDLVSDPELMNKKIETSKEIMYTVSSNWDGNMVEMSHISAIGNILYTTYNMWLFIVSYILVLAMVGAILLTIRQSKSTLSKVDLDN